MALRRIVFRLCSLFGREASGFHGTSPRQVEYVGITADTSEAGAKMRFFKEDLKDICISIYKWK